ncbi:hypothetical protein BJ138DRAFT_1166645 [Hygrophoropsis aurantiaca]|uniref:Uncharacterized protein n=1 Tax=Hygrophoropsis aurantiaca TaxID=72124 RepID=A0ACB7ZU31_9AGAM|nr:hypothetical protein BJ138DRAFT_1166645 [Hygrophoropsis aurantiaca]
MGKRNSHQTPTQKAAEMRAKKVSNSENIGNKDEGPSLSTRPMRGATKKAYEEAVWLKTTSRKRAASTTTGQDKPKQPRMEQDIERARGAPAPSGIEGLKKDFKSKQKSHKTEIPDISKSDDNDYAESDSQRSFKSDEEAEQSTASEDDLYQLHENPTKLKATLGLERPHYRATSTKEVNNLYVNSSGNAMKHHSRSSSMASSNALSFGSGPAASDTPGLDSDLDVKPTVSRYRQTLESHELKKPSEQDKKKLKKHGRRQEKQEREKAIWRESRDNDLDDKITTVDKRAITTRQPVRSEEDWPVTARLHYSSNGKVNLTDQQAHIQDMLRSAIKSTHQHLAFEDAYPDLDKRRKMAPNTLLDCTDERPAFQAVRERIKQDAKFVRVLAAVAEARISKFRNGIRSAAQRHTISTFSLTKGCDEKIAELLENNRFIFPFDANGEPIKNKPFQNPAILSTIEDGFFGDESCVGIKFQDMFTSTLESAPDEHELPPAMMLLAAVAVCSVILSFSTEKVDKNFDSEYYAGRYRTLAMYLDGIYETSERKYHVLMSKTYQTVSGTEQRAFPGVDAKKILMHIDMDGMEE